MSLQTLVQTQKADNLSRIEDGPGWLTEERRVWIAAVLIAGLAGFGIGNGHTTQGAIEHVSMQYGTAKAEAHCEHRNAVANARVATQAIVSATSDNVPIPDPHAVAVDNCPH